MQKGWATTTAEIVAEVIAALVDSLILYWAWNSALASLFHGPQITYGQALMLWLVVDIVLARARSRAVKVKEDKS